MSFVKLQDGRSTYALDSIRLRNQREASSAPQANTVELYMKEGVLYQVDEEGRESKVSPDINIDLNNLNGNVNIDGNLTVTGDLEVDGKLHAPGSVVQVQTAISGPTRQTIVSTTPVAVTGLSINFTPKYANSLIIVEANIASTQTYVTSFGIFKNGNKTVTTTGNSNENGMQVTMYAYLNVGDVDGMYSTTFKHFETSVNTTARTYAVYATSGWLGTARTLYINDRGGNDMPSFSTMTVTEVAQ